MPDAKAEIFHQVPDDLNEILTKHAKILAIWQSLTPKARNEWICWLTMVKKEETRTSHLQRLQEELQNGKRRPCCWPGCPHARPNAAKWFKASSK
jgi:uncharacterized protein YdeI (YjbR/CyaY-like superfamily)